MKFSTLAPYVDQWYSNGDRRQSSNASTKRKSESELENWVGICESDHTYTVSIWIKNLIYHSFAPKGKINPFFALQFFHVQNYFNFLDFFEAEDFSFCSSNFDPLGHSLNFQPHIPSWNFWWPEPIILEMAFTKFMCEYCWGKISQKFIGKYDQNRSIYPPNIISNWL